MADSATPETFATRLWDHRRRLGLTQAVLAERAGLGVRTIQDLEDGAHRPQQATTVGLVEALGLVGDERRAFELAGRPAPRERHAETADSRSTDAPRLVGN